MPAIAVTSQQSLRTSSLLLTELTEQCRSLSLSWGCRVYATRRDLFIPAIVDPRPSRTVHCPDLNACLVNESRLKHDRVDCQTIHFGYAIPINIVPVHESPELVELILDQSAEFSIQAINFLLNHHPQLRKQQRFYEMAATAKHDLRRKFPADTTPSGEEDIAAIAKQISDHAEAIYQTWKSRGLAPTEILTCHSNETAVDKFGSALTPCNLPTIGNNVTSSKALPSPSLKHSSPTADDILTQTPNLDDGNLEKLVNNFVVEDKARIAASKQKSSSNPLPSSIQFALQKFEKNSMQQQQMVVSTRDNINPIDDSKKLTSVLLSSPFSNKPSQIVKPQIFTKTLGSRHCEVFLETIETTFPVDLTSSKKATQQKRPASILIASSPTNSSLNIDSIHSTYSGLTTWPLKNKLNDARKIIDVSHASAKTSQQGEIAKILPAKDEKRSVVIETNSCVYIDEVTREEERLINALKTGAVITEESERTMTSERKKPAIKQEKPKIESVKPIIIGSHHGISLMVSSSATSNSVTSDSTTAAHISNATVVVSTNHNPLINESKSFNKDDLSALSMVDYAKIRYKAAQQNPPTQQRLEEQRASSHPYHSTTEQLVSSARTKFEMEIQKDKEVKDLDKDLIATRWGPRISSPRPRLEQTVPHPELTNQQKQHIRAVTGTGNNPVRPFLTRGSVAERVLIFEKCPSELLLDKRGPRQPAINTWRSGHEVQNKAQVFFFLSHFHQAMRMFYFSCYNITLIEKYILCLICKQSVHNSKFSFS